MAQRFKVHDTTYPHFVTSTVRHWIPIFCCENYTRILVNSLIHCCDSRGLAIHGYVIMPNHFHMICSSSKDSLPEIIRDFKGYTSRKLGALLADDGRTTWLRSMTVKDSQAGIVKVWEDGYHPEEIRSEPFFTRKLNYMHNNPIRTGFVEDASEWKYSSAGFYYKDKVSLVPIVPLMW